MVRRQESNIAPVGHYFKGFQENQPTVVSLNVSLNQNPLTDGDWLAARYSSSEYKQ